MSKIKILAQRVKQASSVVSVLSTAKKNQVLRDVAKALLVQKNKILRANAKDMRSATRAKMNAAFLDRLLLTEARIKALSQAVLAVAKLPDPVGEVVSSKKIKDLLIDKVRIPLGVVCMIYESRPNVTIDAASLCFKAGNAIILRGGSEAFESSRALVAVFTSVLNKHKLDPHAVTLVPDTHRDTMISLLDCDDAIDVVIPRGGEGWMRFIKANTRIPVIRHDKGVCSLFVDASAKLEKSIAVIVNAKADRPGVCNALETLYVHEKIAKRFLPLLALELQKHHVIIRGDETVQKILPGVAAATELDFATEYLDLILAIKVVKNGNDAIHCIKKYYSRHTDGILTENAKNAASFARALDSSCIIVNASTRFHDGGELGLGAEIGISTTKLHAYGVMGLVELTIPRFLVRGRYSVRS